MVDLFRKMDEDFGGSISKDTQPLCRVSLNIATAPLLLGCSSTRRCAQALFGLVEWTLWSMPLFTEWIRTSTLKMSLHGRRDSLPDELWPPRLFALAELFPSCCVEGSGEGAGGDFGFARLSLSCQ